MWGAGWQHSISILQMSVSDDNHLLKWGEDENGFFFPFQRAFERAFSSFPVALPVSWWQQTSFPGNSRVRDRIKTPRGAAANSDHPGKSARTKSGSSLLQAPKQSLSPACPAEGIQSLCSFGLRTIKLAGEEIQNGISLDCHSTSFTSGEGEGILPWVHLTTQL